MVPLGFDAFRNSNLVFNEKKSGNWIDCKRQGLHEVVAGSVGVDW